MIEVLGLDIGGANTKAALMSVQKGKLTTVRVATKYFPIWKEPHKLKQVLLKLKQQLGANNISALGLTMTAELSDAYQTKREGVHHVLDCTKQVFPEVPIYVLCSDVKLKPFDFAKREPLEVAAANWAATGWLVAQHLKVCVVVDVGSTSTSIIPIVNGHVAASGKTDLEKLMFGELVYTGSLRTNVATIVHSVPIKKGIATIASELFALSGDVHIVLGNITEEEYTSETADGRGKTIPEALARLSRVVCADTEMLTGQELVNIARYIFEKQVQQIAEGLARVYSNVKQRALGEVPVVITGLGKNFLAGKAAESIRPDKIVDLSTLVQAEAVLATPAFGVAFMTATRLEGENIK